jgi:phenylalanine-4-hydroxylase
VEDRQQGVPCGANVVTAENEATFAMKDDTTTEREDFEMSEVVRARLRQQLAEQIRLGVGADIGLEVFADTRPTR